MRKNPFVVVFCALVLDIMVSNSLGKLLPEILAAISGVLFYFEYRIWEQLKSLEPKGLDINLTKLFFITNPSMQMKLGIILLTISSFLTAYFEFGSCN